MTDVSKAIYAGDWELYPHDGKVELQDFTHPKIVLMFDGRAVRSGEAVEVVRRALEE